MEKERMNNKGFTVVELIASFALTMTISVFLFEILIEVKDVFVETSIKSNIIEKMGVISKNIKANVSKRCSDTSCNGLITASNNDSKITVDGQEFTLPSGVTVSNFSSSNPSCDANKNNCTITVNFKLNHSNLSEPYEYKAVYYWNNNPVDSNEVTMLTPCSISGDIELRNGTTCSKTCGGGTYNRIAYSKITGERCPTTQYDQSSGGSACNTQACVTTFTGTIYRISTKKWEKNQNISAFTAGVDYVTDVSKLKNMSENADVYYLKHTVVDDIVTESSVCFNINGWNCLRGVPEAYESNYSLVMNLWRGGGWLCNEDSTILCRNSDRNFNIHIYDSSYGSVGANFNNTIYGCTIWFGKSWCDSN